MNKNPINKYKLLERKNQMNQEILKAGHSLHQAQPTDNYKINIQLQPMPEEFKNVKVIICCNDCDKESETNFHFIGHECKYCNSWNTWKKSTINHS